MILIDNKNLKEVELDGKPVKEIYDNNTGELMWFYGEEPVPVTEEYFYIKNEYSGKNTVHVMVFYEPSHRPTDYARTIEYSMDKVNWTSFEFEEQTYPYVQLEIDLDDGDIVYFRNDNCYFSTLGWQIVFHLVYDYSVGGDILSLLDYTNKSSVSMQDRCFFGLLGSIPGESIYNTGLVDASKLILPETTSDYCYYSMFYEAHNMLHGPELPAKTLSPYSYKLMYYGCSSLLDIYTHADDISATECTRWWVDDVSATGTFHNLGSAVYTSGDDGIPSGWTVVTS